MSTDLQHDMIEYLDISIWNDLMEVYIKRYDTPSITSRVIPIDVDGDIDLKLDMGLDLKELRELVVSSFRDSGIVTIHTDQLCNMPESLTIIRLYGLHVVINKPECLISPTLDTLWMNRCDIDIQTLFYSSVLEIIQYYNPNMNSVNVSYNHTDTRDVIIIDSILRST